MSERSLMDIWGPTCIVVAAIGAVIAVFGVVGMIREYMAMKRHDRKRSDKTGQ